MDRFQEVVLKITCIVVIFFCGPLVTLNIMAFAKDVPESMEPSLWNIFAGLALPIVCGYILTSKRYRSKL